MLPEKKPGNKELRYELAENLENLKEQQQSCKNVMKIMGLWKKLCYYKAWKLESWKLIKQKKKKRIWSSISNEIRRFKGPSQISWKWKTITERTG